MEELRYNTCEFLNKLRHNIGNLINGNTAQHENGMLPSVNRLALCITIPLRWTMSSSRVIARKTPPDEEEKYPQKKHFSMIKDTTIISHSRSTFDRNFPWVGIARTHLPTEYRISLSSSLRKKKFRSYTPPLMKRLFPLLWVDFVEKYR